MALVDGLQQGELLLLLPRCQMIIADVFDELCRIVLRGVDVSPLVSARQKRTAPVAGATDRQSRHIPRTLVKYVSSRSGSRGIGKLLC